MNLTKTAIRADSGPGNWAEVLLVPAANAVHDLPSSPTPRDIEFARIPVDAIVPNPRQPRKVFDEDALAELTVSIAQVGLLQPIVVRPASAAPVDKYELVAGERRLRCVRQLGWPVVPAVVRLTDDGDLLRDALLENLQRAALNPLEEAAAYQQLLADFGCTQEELAERIGRSRPHISNTIRLLKLPPAVQRRVAAGVLSQGHARALLSLVDPESMESLATRIVSEGLSVRTVEEIVSVGDRPPAQAKPRRPPSRRSAAGLESVAEDLAERLDTRVVVTMGRSKGRVTIEFAGIDDLERILELIATGGSPT
ncbi:MAG: ParB/RepB/Spo0J family partition protein [Candidatus Nanopelagicales bacterium]